MMLLMNKLHVRIEEELSCTFRLVAKVNTDYLRGISDSCNHPPIQISPGPLLQLMCGVPLRKNSRQSLGYAGDDMECVEVGSLVVRLPHCGWNWNVRRDDNLVDDNSAECINMLEVF